jgi:spore germination cell wall hydrolase CwlJ-like protein
MMRVALTKPKRAHAFLTFGLPLFLMPSLIGGSGLSTSASDAGFPLGQAKSHLIGSPFGTIHAATFQFPIPLGSAMPEVAKPTPASFTPYEGETDLPSGRRFADRAFPSIDRTHKGDRLTGAPEQSAAREADQATTDSSAADGASVAHVPSGVAALPQEAAPDERTPDFGAGDDPSAQAARLYFGAQPLGDEVATIQPWAPGETPILDGTQFADLDYKRPESLEPTATGAPTEGQSIAAKGEVTGEGKRPRTPAERLGLTGEAREKSEKCLTNAIYFEARGEPVRGQMAVAQVVMNRVFSGYYPDSVCGVVYQNANRRNRCQFSFACDRHPDRVTEPDAFDRAQEIARETLDGKLWLADVGKATHYHAYWVRPSWVREMSKLYKIGVHTFYRPRDWGDGADAPSWGDPAATAEAEDKLRSPESDDDPNDD